MMRVVFILPGMGRSPVGGLKIVYEYANRLAALGHGVSLVHAPVFDQQAGLRTRIRGGWHFIKHQLRADYGPRRWFALSPAVRLIWAPTLAARHVPEADVVIATAWQTAEWVANYPDNRGEKFYFIQHKETWSGPEERVMASWKLPLRKIVISRWLQQIAIDMGEQAEYVPNGLDFGAFGMDVPSEQRDPRHVMMLYHRDAWKGTKDGLQALQEVRESLPELQVTLFGVPEPGPELPEWMEYHRQPTPARLRELYNRAALFVAPSLAEGWGLPGSEAMMCGAAVVATDIGGHREFAEAERTALMAPPHAPQELARQILRLCTDDDLRYRIATHGHANIQQFTWERAVQAFESVLQSEAGRGAETEAEHAGTW